MTQFPRDRHGLIRRSASLAADISDDDLRAGVKSGALRRLTPGVYVESGEQFNGPAGAEQLYRLQSIAVATAEIGGSCPLSHVSAAAVHRLPLLKPNRSRVHLTNGKAGGGKTTRLRHIHAGTLGPDEVTLVDGVAVTSLSRTAVDVAGAGGFAQALTAFDGALRAGADRGQMAAALLRRRVGARPARRALLLADGRSESVGESWSRAQMIDAGLPAPTLQRQFRCSGGLYRGDFCWGDKLIGEFDGAVKYARYRRPGESITDAVLREKSREDELRSLGFMVVRWTWGMLESGGMLTLVHSWLDRLDLI